MNLHASLLYICMHELMCQLGGTSLGGGANIFGAIALGMGSKKISFISLSYFVAPYPMINERSLTK